MREFWRLAPLWILAIIAGCLVGWNVAKADYDGQTTPEIREWFRSLMQPDRPTVSCCGDTDAYYADNVSQVGDETIATITDNRGHPIPNGTKIKIPPNKLNHDPNKIGHVIVFLAGTAENYTVYCFIPAWGV